MTTSDIDLETIDWSAWSEDPYPLYRVLRDEHPLFFDEPNNMYLVTRYADAAAVLSDPARFSNIPLGFYENIEGRISPLRHADPPRHSQLRRLVMPMFTPGEMRRLEPYFSGVARDLLDAAEQLDVVEISTALARPLPGRVTCDLLGVPLGEHSAFVRLTEERLALLAASTGRISGDGQRPLADVRADLWDIVGPVVNARRVTPEHDVITLLVEGQERLGRTVLSDDVLVDMLLHLLTGGFHTTQHLVEMLLSTLADRPDLWSRLHADRSLVLPAIEEMLRIDAPVQSLPRRAAVETQIADTPIPADATIAVVYGAANHDDRVFEQPDVFSLDRRAKRHMAFSAGIHYCPGAPVSRFEVAALLNEMLDRYTALERVGSSVRWPIEQTTVEAMHGFQAVPLRFVRQ